MEGDSERNAEDVEASAETRENSSSASPGARQMAVNFMPSRQLTYNTLRHRRTNSEHNNLLDEPERPDNDVEEQDPVNKQAEIIVKELEQQKQLMDDNPVSEELRREALRDLPQCLTMKRSVRAKLSASVSLRSRRRPISCLKRTKYRISFAWKRFKERIRDAMFSIELWYEAIRNIEGQFGSAVGSYFRMVRRLFLIDLSLSVVLFAFLVIPQGLHDAAVADNVTEYRWRMMWLFGQDEDDQTLMFYGHYHDGNVGTSIPYYMPFAYFFTMICLYLVFFVVLCYRTANSYKRNFIETEGGVSHVFANKVFCGWDFGIVSQHAALLNATSIYHELQELLSEQNKKKSSLTFGTIFLHRTTNVILSLFVFSTIGSLLYGLWKLLEVYGHSELLVSGLIALVVTICPVLFNLIGRLEYYSPRTGLYVTLCRTWLLDVSIILLLFVFWSQSDTVCWESRFGQQAYRLVMLDAIISLLVLPLVEIIRACFYKRSSKGSPPEFNIAYNSLTLIYNQSLLWFGMLFSPLLSLVVMLKFLLLFYVKRECALRACQPARKVWRAAQTQTVLYVLVTLSLFATLFGLGSLFLRMPSNHCGPFRRYEQVISVLTEGVLSLSSRPTLSRVLASVTRPAVIACLMLLLGVLVYYCRAKALAQQSMVQLLRHMLQLQAKDKDFLLTAIGKVSNGEWLYSPKPMSVSDSHTFRYMREVRQPNNSSFRLSRHNDTRVEATHANDGDSDSSFSWRGEGN